MTLAVEQTLNGLQFGVMLFLLAAGLTLVFGIMGVINLAHGSMYMIGAYVAASSAAGGLPFPLAVLAGALAAAIAGAIVELVVVRRLYGRNHLDQVLATFGLILIANDGVSIVWGRNPLQMNMPDTLSGSIAFGDLSYPIYRLLLIGCGCLLAVALAVFVARTRLGALIRAGATHRELVGALGVNIVQLNTIVFALGALLAGVAGALLAPILSVQIGMGEQVLIMTFVAVVIGGLGSIRGAFVGALAIGVVDTLGRAYIPSLLRLVTAPDVADSLGGGLSAVAIYVLMAIVLIWKPRGLFPVSSR
jgi:branched-chain amino acid transport system permease protein